MIDGEELPWPEGEEWALLSGRSSSATLSIRLAGEPSVQDYVDAFRRLGAVAVRATEALDDLGREVRLTMETTSALARWLRASLLPRPWSGPRRGPRRRKHPTIRRRTLRS